MTRAVKSDNPAELARAKDQFSKVATIIFVGDNYDDNVKTMICDEVGALRHFLSDFRPDCHPSW